MKWGETYRREKFKEKRQDKGKGMTEVKEKGNKERVKKRETIKQEAIWLFFTDEMKETEGNER